MSKAPKGKKEKIKYFNSLITKNTKRMSELEDYNRTIQAIVPLVELAHKMSARVDLDNGEGKKTWRMILADVLTIKEEVADEYSGVADLMQEYTYTLNLIKEDKA